MISECRNCGGRIQWEIGEAQAVCTNCGAVYPLEKSDVYREARRLAEEGSEESLEQAMQLFRSLRGWQDAGRQYISCRTQLGRMRWKQESVRLKEYEERNEVNVARRKKITQALLAALLLCIAVLTTVSMLRFRQYNRAAEYFTAGEYERSAAAFLEMGDYKDSRARVYMSAVALYNAGRYEKALPYFVALDGYMDNGYYLNKCREKLAVQ